MNKSILIIDTPKSCADCRLKRGLFCGENGNSLYDYIHYDDSTNNKPNWCPLKHMPQKIDISEDELYEKQYMCFEGGWNACIESILGEEECQQDVE